MKIIDCEFHYYLPELMEYLSTRDNAMRYYPETKILEVRDKVFAHFDGVTNEYPVIDDCGSDYPYESLSDMMKFMDTLELTEEEKEKVFHLNAEKYILSK